ncbi:MAG: FraH-related protein [uncultured Chloroflexi bacterium]|uniref:FraH-related protein n=1 Tax=uncultured Chloroflexota bacterium TaxID=166587 RepID=A0A6J4IV30_9CHLR|nr:MAG: FraH-related protein [uncultured Chloroflexota bacterium]
MQTCEVCGKQNPPGLEYCEDCGTSLKGTAQGGGQQAASAPGSQPGAGSSAGASGTAEAASPAAAGAQPPVADAVTTPEGASVADASPPTPAGPAPQAAPSSLAMDPSAGPGAAAGAAAPADAGAGIADAGAPGSVAGAAGAAGTGASTGGGQPRLLIKKYGALTGDEIPLMGERLVVGRFDPETGPVDIDLSAAAEAEHISRHHAELYREAGQWLVRDLGSTNGVFVRTGEGTFGPRITAPRPLADGDEVAFGNARLIFRSA